MTTGPGDTISVAADTLNLPYPGGEFSIGSIIPIVSATDGLHHKPGLATAIQADYFPGLRRHDGELRPREAVNTDISFILLSVSMLIITLLSAFGRRRIISGLTSLSFRKQEKLLPPGTSEVFSWPPVLRNLFTILNISLFSAISLLETGIADPYLLGGFPGLTSVLAGSFLVALLVRHLTLIMLAGATGLKDPFREYMKVIYNTWFAASAVLFVLNGIILFAPVNNPLPLIISGLVLTSIFLLIRSLRLISIFHNRHVSIFYFLLYLCALELLPVLVVLKIMGTF